MIAHILYCFRYIVCFFLYSRQSPKFFGRGELKNDLYAPNIVHTILYTISENKERKVNMRASDKAIVYEKE